MKTPHDLLTVMARHIGHDNGVTVDTLAAELSTSGRQVRKLVSASRMEGYAICGHPRDGYYLAAKAEELEQTCQFLRNRAMHSLTLEARLRNIPMPDLIGQLHLNT